MNSAPTHLVPTHARDMAQSLANDARTVNAAQDRYSTRAGLRQAIAAAKRLAVGARAMATELRRQYAAAELAEAHARRDAIDAERRNAAILEQRGQLCPR